jgi:hypothetical protein
LVSQLKLVQDNYWTKRNSDIAAETEGILAPQCCFCGEKWNFIDPFSLLKEMRPPLEQGWDSYWNSILQSKR